MGDKIAVVTGAGSGIGAAVAMALGGDGWTVVLAGRRRARLEELATAYPDLSLDPVPTDVTDEESVRSLFDVIDDATRSGRSAFNNAGMGAPPRELDEIPLEEWQAVVNVNLTGAVPLHARGISRHAAAAAARRPHHQQWLDLGAFAAPSIHRLHRDQARHHRPDQVDRAGRTPLRHRL